MFILNTKINYSYDENDDILYVSIGKPKPAVTTEIEEGILVRKDLKTGKIIGVTILDYMERINNNEKINVPKQFDLSLINI